MNVNYRIEFYGKSPKAEEVLQNLKINTGLNIELDTRDFEESKIYSFSCPKLHEAFGFYDDHNIYTIQSGHDERCYLIGATLNTLAQMGGIHKYDN